MGNICSRINICCSQSGDCNNTETPCKSEDVSKLIENGKDCIETNIFEIIDPEQFPSKSRLKEKYIPILSEKMSMQVKNRWKELGRYEFGASNKHNTDKVKYFDALFILHSKQVPENKNADDLDINPEDYYIGGFKKYGEFYKPCGKGVLMYKDRNFYEGYFKKGHPNGEGRMIVIKNDIINVIKGRFKNGIFKDKDLYQTYIDNESIQQIDFKDIDEVCLI